ncbi:MAG: aminoacyl-histidine dipeptidase [Gammaproteobacteria bacterium]|nr:aminoacyl-histidine dipeptidase [Gammaproteobacteria bacterium]
MINQLNPKALWEHFSQFCLIPRPSKHEQAIISYIRQQGELFHAKIEQDDIGNILLRVPASKGFEKSPVIALQSHVDMVAQANSDTPHDFMKDPLQLQIVDGWVTATGTTLGADNGIGCAAMLALMSDHSVIHGPLELLFTVDEEAGMGGAFGLQKNWLKAKQLLNLDTEEEGEIYIGCAGGVDINSSLECQWQQAEVTKEQVKLSLTGLLGGHSGVDIHLNRANANIILFQELLNLSQQFDFQLHSINGGTLRNAIPREAFVSIFTSDADAVIQWTNTRHKQLSQLYCTSEPNLTFTAIKSNSDNHSVLSIKQSQNLLSLFASHPNGVIKNSDVLPGVVESSNNLGVINLEAGQTLIIENLCRSASDDERDAHAIRIAQYQQLFNLNVEINGAYPGWQPNNDSQLLKQGLALYQRLFDKKAVIQVIHAGLECGLLSGKYPDCDMLSFGPTITGAHSPREQVNIKSVEKFWDYLVEFIAELSNN